MATIKIDNIDYDLDSLSEETKNSLNMLQAAEREIQRLNMRLALAQTARAVYANAVKKGLPPNLAGSEIKFS
jgi:hypothetical protein